MDSLNSGEIWEEFYKEFVKECKKLYENKGFTYEIPSEEQIRAVLYTFLRSKGYLIELESDLFKKDTEKNTKNVAGMYDLRIINEDYDLIVEIKRAWGLKYWSNGYKEFIDSWDNDIKKLDKLEKEEYESENINPKRKKCFVLVIFTNKDLFYDRLKEKIDEFNQNLNNWELIEKSGKEELGGGIFCNLFVWVEK